MDFSAGILLERKLLDELLKEGHVPGPTQWIETDQNEYLKRPGVAHIVDTKGRLVGCGQCRGTKDIRADEPTCP
eukprot:9772563-Karenia_brevis.AAC.1